MWVQLNLCIGEYVAAPYNGKLLLPQNMPEQLVLSSLGPSVLYRSSKVDWDPSSLSGSRGSKGGHGPSLQLHRGIIVTEGNGLHETGQNRSGETEATRFFPISAGEVVVAGVLESRG
ncbi:hypothetical protein V2J09_001745 [Rumex salicifolius]